MTNEEAAVILAARDAVVITESGSLVTADLDRNPAKIAVLIRAVARLKQAKDNDYWRTR